MDREAIKNIMPHRDNMLLLDEVTKEDGVAHGKLKITGDEWFLKGHFPGNPIVPGVILCEILAQSICVLIDEDVDDSKVPVYTGLNNVKFRSSVRPGDVFETRCRIVKKKSIFFFAEGEGYVGDQLCVKAEFSFALTEKEK